jgi:hypothetical protein
MHAEMRAARREFSSSFENLKLVTACVIKHDASVEVNAQILNYDGRVNTIIKCMELINDEKTWQHY